MGTNYYLRYDICNECNRYNEIHIGKSSCGWKFMFEINEDNELNSYERFIDFLTEKLYKNSKIFDEYGRESSLAGLMKLIEDKQKDTENKDHSPIYTHHDYDGFFLDEKGYNFCKGEFS